MDHSSICSSHFVWMLMTNFFSFSAHRYVHINSVAFCWLSPQKLFEVPIYTKNQSQIPFARVNHNKYMVTDQHAYIGKLYLLYRVTFRSVKSDTRCPQVLGCISSCLHRWVVYCFVKWFVDMWRVVHASSRGTWAQINSVHCWAVRDCVEIYIDLLRVTHVSHNKHYLVTDQCAYTGEVGMAEQSGTCQPWVHGVQ